MKKITLPLKQEDIDALTAGESVLLTGTILTGRDCAHKRICEMLDRGEKLPFPLAGETIYYAGPCPAPAGKVCGSCGPTTSARMDSFAPRLLDLGQKGMIGKGERSEEVCASIVKNRAVYFAAIGGAGALYGNAVKKSELVAFPDLLSEAVYRFEIENFPCIVAIDSRSGNIYKRERNKTSPQRNLSVSAEPRKTRAKSDTAALRFRGTDSVLKQISQHYYKYCRIKTGYPYDAPYSERRMRRRFSAKNPA